MEVLFVVWAIAAFGLFTNGIYDIRRILLSLRWLKQERGGQHLTLEDAPYIVVLLPVLREQRLIADTLQILADLKYPLSHLRIFVITTEKEIAHREQARARLALLAKEIASRHFPTAFLVEKYLGVLPEDTLRKTIKLAGCRKGEADVHRLLLEIFNSYPTTLDIVSNDVARLNEQLSIHLFTHLHYPGTNGDMSQQLEFALQQLPSHLAI